PWINKSLGTNGIVTTVDEKQPRLTVVLRDGERPVALLRATRQEGAPAFERRDTMMAAILVRQAESWLSVVELTGARDEAVARAEMSDAASRVIGDMGAE